jgi:hypothetical protein
MASDNAGNCVRDKGANNENESNSTGGRGKYKCQRCGVQKIGHDCPYEPGKINVSVKIKKENLKSFKFVTKLVSKKGYLTLCLPRWCEAP